MPPINSLPIVVQRGSYRLQLSNLKITDEDLPQLLQRATTELTSMYSQSMGKKATFADVPLIEVTFNKNNITDLSCSAIIRFVAQNSHVQSVELLGNGLTDASAPHIVHMITTLPVQRLKVGDNALSHVGASIIAEALKDSHKGFLQLHIGGNPIGDKGVQVLCDACLSSKVEVLGLRDVAFSEDGWEALGAVVASPTTGVHDFQLRGNILSLQCAAAFAKGIGRFSLDTSHSFKLSVLSVGNCGISGASSKALFGVLGRANNLVQIDLSNNPLGDEGLSHLVAWLASGHRNHLQWLSLQKTSVTASGALHMVSGSRCDTVLAALKYLDLSLNALGAEGAAPVATIIQWGMVLEKINLRRCMLAGSRLSEICSAVNHHPTLKEIDFASNFSGPENAKHWAEIVFATTKLEHVVLTDNDFGADDTANIVQSLLAGPGRSLSVLQLGGQSNVPPLGNVINPPVISKLNEALSRNRQQVNDTKRPSANFQFDPVKLRMALGYPPMPVPMPLPGAIHPECRPYHPQLAMHSMHSNTPHNLQSAVGNFMCYAPRPDQHPQVFMCTPLAGPAVYGSCGPAAPSPYAFPMMDNAMLYPPPQQTYPSHYNQPYLQPSAPPMYQAKNAHAPMQSSQSSLGSFGGDSGPVGGYIGDNLSNVSMNRQNVFTGSLVGGGNRSMYGIDYMI
eukprot:GILI01009283.1.p1 GENE.GILI01009283.1~~GILI01009283.1.p1  ORF type:complete len:678 (-),score=132.28 GILI01009283.1:460-2493(-)